MAQPQIIEGTAEEIAAQLRKAAPNGKRLKVSVMPAEEREHFYFKASPEEFERALDAIAEMNRDLPGLPPEAFDREKLYEDTP